MIVHVLLSLDILFCPFSSVCGLLKSRKHFPEQFQVIQNVAISQFLRQTKLFRDFKLLKIEIFWTFIIKLSSDQHSHYTFWSDTVLRNKLKSKPVQPYIMTPKKLCSSSSINFSQRLRYRGKLHRFSWCSIINMFLYYIPIWNQVSFDW